MPLEPGLGEFRGVQAWRYLFLKGKKGKPPIRALLPAIGSLLKLDQNYLNEIQVVNAAGVNSRLLSLKVGGAAAVCVLFTGNRRWAPASPLYCSSPPE